MDKQNSKLKKCFTFWLTQILSTTYLIWYIGGGFHAKFQDSRTNNIKSAQPVNHKYRKKIQCDFWKNVLIIKFGFVHCFLTWVDMFHSVILTRWWLGLSWWSWSWWCPIVPSYRSNILQASDCTPWTWTDPAGRGCFLYPTPACIRLHSRWSYRGGLKS